MKKINKLFVYKNYLMSRFRGVVCLLFNVVAIDHSHKRKYMPEICIGKNCKIYGYKIFFKGYAHIGEGSWIECIDDYKEYVYDSMITFGENFHANNSLHVACANKIIFGDNVLIGSNVLICDHSHGVYNGMDQSHPNIPPIERKLSRNKINIKSNVWIGDGVQIVGNVKIGAGVIVAANSTVTKDIPDNVIVAGSPARIVKKWSSELSQWETC